MKRFLSKLFQCFLKSDTDRIHKENKLEQDITLPYLKKAVIFSITFGFFGVNMAFALQSAMMGRIFQTLGANPNNLGWFFILPPLVGIMSQPRLALLIPYSIH